MENVTDFLDAPNRTILDAPNRTIIEELQRDGRRSYAWLAAQVGLSEAAVRQRVTRLRETGVINVVAVTDPTRMGFTRQALIGIKASGDVRLLAEKLAAVPEIDYVVLCAGSFDILVELVCEDDAHLLKILNATIRALPQVQQTETFVYLELTKQTYSWGTRG